MLTRNREVWEFTFLNHSNSWKIFVKILYNNSHNFLSCHFQHLKQQQDGLSHLISVIKDDLEDIKLIEHGLSDSGHMKGGILS